MAKKVSFRIDERMCKQCGICSELCPKQVLAQEVGFAPTVIAPENCIACKLCQMRCPDFAIEVEVSQ